MGTRKLMGLQDHLTLADSVRPMYYELQRIYVFVANNMGKTKKAARKARQALNALDSVRCELDSEYHRIITDSTFHKYGHIYYTKKEEL
jgi:hypothetical protein